MTRLHTAMVKTESYEPAKNKPTKQDQQIALLIAANKEMRSDLDRLRNQQSGGGNNSNGTSDSGKTNGRQKRRNRQKQSGGGSEQSNNATPAPTATPTANTVPRQDSRHPDWKLKRNNNETKKTKDGKVYYWCSKCNRGQGMWAISHGDAHPSERHIDNWRPVTDNQGGSTQLAVAPADVVTSPQYHSWLTPPKRQRVFDPD